MASRLTLATRRGVVDEDQKAQLKGIVGFFYRMYIRKTRDFIFGRRGTTILDIGCGEGIIHEGKSSLAFMLDNSMRRLIEARGKAGPVVCGDARYLPFKNESFDTTLLVAIIEHVDDPERVLQEVARVMRPHGLCAILFPNDFWMSLGRCLLLKYPPRNPGHVSFITPKRIRNAIRETFNVIEYEPLPFRRLPFWMNMYYWMVIERRPCQ